MYLSEDFLKNVASKKFLQIITEAFVAEFNFSRIPCFRHVLLNTFERIPLKYENYSLRDYFRHSNNVQAAP